MSKDTPAATEETGAKAVAKVETPAVTAPAVATPAAPVATSTKYRVQCDDETAIIEAGSIDGAKYRYMRENKICDRNQVWVITSV